MVGAHLSTRNTVVQVATGSTFAATIGIELWLRNALLGSPQWSYDTYQRIHCLCRSFHIWTVCLLVPKFQIREFIMEMLCVHRISRAVPWFSELLSCLNCDTIIFWGCVVCLCIWFYLDMCYLITDPLWGAMTVWNELQLGFMFSYMFSFCLPVIGAEHSLFTQISFLV